MHTPVCCLLAVFFLLLVAPKVRTRMSGFGRGSGCSCSWNAETTFHLHLPAPPPPAPLPSFPVICCISNATADCCGNVCALAALVPAMICLCLHFGLWVPLALPLPLARHWSTPLPWPIFILVEGTHLCRDFNFEERKAARPEVSIAQRAGQKGRNREWEPNKRNESPARCLSAC